MEWPKVGTRVKIIDGSECHGMRAWMRKTKNGVSIVELDTGELWPILTPAEIRPIDLMEID